MPSGEWLSSKKRYAFYNSKVEGLQKSLADAKFYADKEYCRGEGLKQNLIRPTEQVIHHIKEALRKYSRRKAVSRISANGGYDWVEGE